MPTDLKCSKCNEAAMVSVTTDTEIAIDGVNYPVIGIEYSECPNCGYELVMADQARRNDAKYADARRKSRNFLLSTDIAALRREFGLTQTMLAQLVGGGRHAIYKYEAGVVTQSESMDLLLRVVRDVPGVLTYLARHKNLPDVTEVRSTSVSIGKPYTSAVRVAGVDSPSSFSHGVTTTRREDLGFTFQRSGCINA